MKIWIIICSLLFAHLAFADAETKEAIRKTQADMKKKGFEKEAGKTSPEAKAVSDHVKGLAGTSENEAEIYSLSADILGNFENLSPDEIMKVLEEGKSNPEAFANRFTPEQRKKMKELSDRLPASQRKNP